ncbi:MAG: aspartyl protease family protein [Steroidobacteraceae bacterium]
MLKRIIPGWSAVLLALPLVVTARADDQCHILRSPAIPVTMLDRQPIIAAKINGIDARFLVDTGSFFQLMYPSAVAEFKLKVKWQPGLYTQGLGGYDSPNSATVKSFTFGTIQVPNVPFLVGSNDLSQPGIAGILGENLFQIWDEEFDLANGVMRLVEPQHCGGKILAYWAVKQAVSVVDIQPTTKADTELIGSASVNGHTIRVLFDTGSDTSLLSLEAAKRIGITPASPGVVAAGSSEGIGQQQLVQTWIAPIADFEIGNEKIQHTHVAIGNIHSRYEDPDDPIDMLLGADFFLAHHVYVANSQAKLYFTYSGGPVFDVGLRKEAPAKSPPSGPAAADADASPSDLIRRGLAAESRGLLDQAVADFTRACTLDSHDADCFYRRGAAHAQLQQQDLALRDFNSALQISPDDYQVMLARAELQVSGLQAGVKPDVDAVDRLAPQADNLRFTLGELYNEIHRYPQAIHELTVWIGYHPDDVRLRAALSDRCWFRAEANQDLDAALQDCNRALHFAAANADILDSRGLVYLRLGKRDEAVADYDAALKQNPKLVTSLFGRALAELGQGEASQGQADIAAAEKIDPKIADFFSSIGLKP